MFHVEKASLKQYEEIVDFYYQLIDEMEEAEYKPMWQREIYPTREMLLSAIKNEWMYLGYEDDALIAAMVVNQEYDENYDKAAWGAQIARNELLIVHLLCVASAIEKRGYGKRMVQYVIDKAKKESKKAIRLDALAGNVPAERLYPSMGFEYRGTITMFYEDTGWAEFRLYEYIL